MGNTFGEVKESLIRNQCVMSDVGEVEKQDEEREQNVECARGRI